MHESSVIHPLSQTEQNDCMEFNSLFPCTFAKFTCMLVISNTNKQIIEYPEYIPKYLEYPELEGTHKSNHQVQLIAPHNPSLVFIM